MEMTVRDFRIAVPQADLDDLARRLETVKWPARSWQAASDWSYGTPEPYLRALVDHWRHGFNWREAEARINRFPQVLVNVDGLDLHVMHVRSPHAGATPLLLVHGWPGSIVEFLDLIPRLTEPEKYGGRTEDAFHVICPSLPGYGFSQTIQEPGMAPDRIARLLARLMTGLGYDRFVAQGGDWGAVCCRFLPDQAPERLIGLHMNLVVPVAPQDIADPESLLSDAERAFMADWTAAQWELTGYAHLQGTKPHTLSFALSDSPVGLAAWIIEKFHRWSDNQGDPRDAISWDALLTNIALYWFSGSIGSSMRLYRELFDALAAGRVTAPRVSVPTGIARYPRELWMQPRSWIEHEYNLVHWYDAPQGGHFAAMEVPALFAQDLWRFHARLRQT